jgi:hypothetical protein
MNDLETIENYVTGKLPEDERTRFETALRTDPALADALAFYVLAKHTAKVDAAPSGQPNSMPAPNSLPATMAPLPDAVAAAAVSYYLLGAWWCFCAIGRSTRCGSTRRRLRLTKNFDPLARRWWTAQRQSGITGRDLYNNTKFARSETVFDGLLTLQQTMTCLKLWVCCPTQKINDVAIDVAPT